MFEKRKLFYLIVVLFLLFSWFASAQTGEGGLESPFSIGAGARMLGMGNAAVAFPDDPSAFVWNPAGMVVVEKKSIGLSLTTLFEGTQYNFIGYVHPTMDIGTFGIGIFRIGTGGIKNIEDISGIPVEVGEMNYWWGKLTFAYAVTVYRGFSVGINLNVNRQVLGYYSTNGFGVDAGLHYTLPFEKGLLSHFHIGCNVTNALSPALKLGTTTETIPLVTKVGLAKKIFFRDYNDYLIFLADYEQGEHTSYRYHMGFEYAWNRMVFARAGYDNGQLTFGGGFRFKNFQLDYGTSFFGDPEYFPRSHQFSLIAYFGMSVPDKKQALEDTRRQDIQRRYDEKVELERERLINESLIAGKDFLEKGDYFNARLEFARILREDKDNLEALRLLEQTTSEERAVQRQREEALLRQDRDKEKRQRDNVFVNQRLTEGIEALQNGDFKNAIEKWREALERDPENPTIRTYIRQAEETLEDEINKMIARANQLIRQENISEAYKVLTQAKNQTIKNDNLYSKVVGEIRRLDRIVDFITNYQEGIQRYGKGDYKNAVKFFKKALDIEPNHTKAKEFYRNSLARSRGSKQDMTDDVREIFYRGIRLYQDGHFEEAIETWEEALKRDPYNIKLLDAIAGARKKIEKFKRSE